MTTHVKRRDPARPGSIPDVLQMFPREVRFYDEVAASVGVRVPVCFHAEVRADGSTYLELEDLSDWQPGADPVAGARTLRDLHDRWAGTAVEAWPWLPRADVGHLVEQLYGERWATLRGRADLTPPVVAFGDSLFGRVVDVERAAAANGPVTLLHGDASGDNMRTSPEGVVALLDWEDLGVGPGVTDLAWFLVSSVDPEEWDAAISAYGPTERVAPALPAAVVQALLSLSGTDEGGTDALAWVAGIEAAAARV